eukprot:TRINITY_DN1757_c0_g1_i2.p1 TRINITY_DN1757_c0_g1~~TRINITY_DN1757_c0_g1_i2.p1  ORF type:complete len:186 (-),score=40.84 TRINITY_DN1757_c0_g1_i2:645-1202(-)
MGAFLEKPITDKETHTTSGNGLTAVTSHMQGWRVSMEDAAVQQHSVGPNQDINLFGVFDGHGGSFCAQYVAHNIEQKIAQTKEWQSQEMSPENLCEALRRAALDVDDEFRAQAAVRSGEDRSGTTAVFGLVTPSHMIVANIGDSRAVLATEGKTVPMSFDHKPTNVSDLLTTISAPRCSQGSRSG